MDFLKYFYIFNKYLIVFFIVQLLEIRFSKYRILNNFEYIYAKLKDPLNPCHLYAGIVMKIKQMLLRDWDMSISYTYREGNMYSNWLAKNGQ